MMRTAASFLLLLVIAVTAAALDKEPFCGDPESVTIIGQDAELVKICKDTKTAKPHKDYASNHFYRECCDSKRNSIYGGCCPKGVRLANINPRIGTQQADLAGIYKLTCCQHDPSGKSTTGINLCCAKWYKFWEDQTSGTASGWMGAGIGMMVAAVAMVFLFFAQ